MKWRIGMRAGDLRHRAEVVAVIVGGDQVIDLLRPASLTAAMMRSASRAAAAPPLPVSMSSDSPDGDTNSVALPPSTSTR